VIRIKEHSYIHCALRRETLCQLSAESNTEIGEWLKDGGLEKLNRWFAI
jgi:hypothetical protein